MKAKVIRTYQDRITGVINSVGETVELTQDRAEELAKGGFVELIKPAKRASRKTAPKTEG